MHPCLEQRAPAPHGSSCVRLTFAQKPSPPAAGGAQGISLPGGIWLFRAQPRRSH